MNCRRWVLCLASVVAWAAASRGQATAVNLTFANSSDRLEDTGSSGITFSLTGDLTYSAGPDGTTAADFNGNTLLTASSSPITNAFTIAFWMNATTAGTGSFGQDWYEGSGLVDGEIFGATQDWGVSLLGNTVAVGIGNPDRTVVSSSSVTTGTWIYVTGTWDASSETSTLYLDGVEQAQRSDTSNLARYTDNPFQIGHDPTTGGYYDGALSDIQIYTTAFTPSQVQANYDLTAVPEPATYSLIAGVGALGIVVWRRRSIRG